MYSQHGASFLRESWALSCSRAQISLVPRSFQSRTQPQYFSAPFSCLAKRIAHPRSESFNGNLTQDSNASQFQALLWKCHAISWRDSRCRHPSVLGKQHAFTLQTAFPTGCTAPSLPQMGFLWHIPGPAWDAAWFNSIPQSRQFQCSYSWPAPDDGGLYFLIFQCPPQDSEMA